ncbi:MAG TPA: hypothetical protein VMR00_08670 [Streptosporangiaceae bacterium]|jgi:hypothetical protein|nr:hypothetical protein [Streptosporangiaceae bacterium]
MYGWIWRRLPGGSGTRALQLAVILIAASLLLWYVVYPWASLHLSFDQAGLG